MNAMRDFINELENAMRSQFFFQATRDLRYGELWDDFPEALLSVTGCDDIWPKLKEECGEHESS